MRDRRPPLSRRTKSNARRLRKQMTFPESLLWSKLRGGQLCGIKFRRQHPIDPFIIDFYCEEHRLAIELDGRSHSDRALEDRDRQTFIESQGIRFLRLDNDEVLKDLDAVLGGILKACGRDPFSGERLEDQRYLR